MILVVAIVVGLLVGGIILKSSANSSRHKVSVTKILLFAKSFGIEQPFLSMVVSNNGTVAVRDINVSLNGTALAPLQNITTGATARYTAHIPNNLTVILTHRYKLALTVTYADNFSDFTSALVLAA
jgi:hypothetical protein